MAKQDNYKDINQIPQEKFELVQHDRPIYDAKIETKSITYLETQQGVSPEMVPQLPHLLLSS